MIARGIIARGGIEGKGKGATEPNPCGCVVAPATKGRGRYVVSRCEEGERLWDELRCRRDELEAGERRGGRKGHKARIDAFALARDEHARHVGLGSAT